MSRDQLILRSIFDNEFFGPRNGLEPRDWQTECSIAYAMDILRFRAAFPDQQHRFCLYAGPGSGKTKAAGLLMTYLFGENLINQVVFVCPNRSILRKTRRDLHHYFNIILPPFHKARQCNGVPREQQGYIITYQGLMNDPTLHRRICCRVPTLVVFDEIHHLGDSNDWGGSAREAFDRVPFILGMTGTPYRSDNVRIPFVTYEDQDDTGLLRFRADYTYSLGRAVADGVCRDPQFIFSGGKVMIRTADDGPEIHTSFDDKLEDGLSGARLRGAVRTDTETRRNILAESLERCRAEHRKVIIFLGGDTASEMVPSEDARVHLPELLSDLGVGAHEYDIVLSDDKESQSKIETFGKSEKWILVSINMVSEGTDIPELSAAIFLTCITSKQTTVQRIGRVLRLMGPDDKHVDALIFMFADPNYKTLDEEIRTEIVQEVKIRRNEGTGGHDGGHDENRRRAEAVGYEGGHHETVKFHGKEIPIADLDAAREGLRQKGLPSTMLFAWLQIFKEA